MGLGLLIPCRDFACFFFTLDVCCCTFLPLYLHNLGCSWLSLLAQASTTKIFAFLSRFRALFYYILGPPPIRGSSHLFPPHLDIVPGWREKHCFYSLSFPRGFCTSLSMEILSRLVKKGNLNSFFFFKFYISAIPFKVPYMYLQVYTCVIPICVCDPYISNANEQ